MANLNKILMGAAFGTLLGSIAMNFFPSRRQLVKTLKSRTQDVTNYLMNEASNRIPLLKKQNPHKFFWSGSIVGLLAGAGTALLLAPKSGKSLRQNIVKAYHNMNDRVGEVIDLTHTNSQIHHKTMPRKRVKPRSSVSIKN